MRDQASHLHNATYNINLSFVFFRQWPERQNIPKVQQFQYLIYVLLISS
jgi:hypothetical protein